jgi:RNA polymerase sigma-70 factor (ECF subfamily)
VPGAALRCASPRISSETLCEMLGLISSRRMAVDLRASGAARVSRPRRMPPPPPQLPTALELPNLPDADVVRLAQEGREAAFRELVRRYERPVFSLVYRMVRDREVAEDLAQDAFIKVLNHIDKYSPEFKFSSWLFKIANNVAIDHLRRRHLDTISMEGSPHAATPDAVEATSFEVAGGQESALDELEAKELGSAIEAAIGRLRPEYRSCILLRHVEGRSYEEIAATLDLPLGTVKTYIHRARHELRRALQHLRE